MKKALSVILASLMLLTLLMPLSVLAANGTFPIDWDKITEEELEYLETMSLISLVDYGTSKVRYVYPEALASDDPITITGISYNEKLNTLTLKNVKTDAALVLTAMGDDFKISVTGYNEIGCIISADLAWGGSIEFTGNGILEVNGDKKYPAAIEIDVSGTGFGVINFENDVSARLVAGIDPETKKNYPVISVYGSSSSDSKSVFRLGDKVVKPVADTSKDFKVNVYEQKKVQVVEKYYGDGIYLEKDGKMYIAELNSAERKTYDVAEITFDKALNNYIILPVIESCKNITINAYKQLDKSKIPSVVLKRNPYPINFNICIDKNGKECVFVDYSDNLSDVEVYQLLEHEKYGTLALLFNPSSEYKELKVKGVNTLYDHYNYSSEIIIKEFASTVPQKVTLKKAVNTNDGVNVTWNTVAGALKYRVYRSEYNPQTKIWSKWVLIGSSVQSSYLDKAVKNGVKYKYTVRAGNRLGYGAYDKTGVSTTYITAPTVKIANTSSGISVSWNKINGATSYIIYRTQHENGKWSDWKKIGPVSAKKNSWVDKSVKSGVAYKYTVRTVNNKSASGYKSSGAIRFLSVPTVKIVNNFTGVKVAWNQIEGTKKYVVYRSEYNTSTKKWSDWKNLGAFGAVTNCIDTTAVSGVYYKYTVRAVNGGSKGACKASAGLLYLEQPIVKITNVSSGIKVLWTKSVGASGYMVFRSELVNGKWSDWENMGTAKADRSAWTDGKVKDGVQYRYTVRAVNGKVMSAGKSTTGLVRLSQPNVKAVVSNNNIVVSWNKISASQNYVIYRSELVEGKWTSWKNLGTLGTVTSYTDTTVENGKTYKYTVRAKTLESLSSYKASDSVLYKTKTEQTTTPTSNTQTTQTTK